MVVTGTTPAGSSSSPSTTDVLFRTIEEWHGAGDESGAPTATAWADAAVLDAGTGRSSLRWLVNSVRPRHVTAVTADPARAAALREEFGFGDSAVHHPRDCVSTDHDGQPVHSGECTVLVGSWVPSSELSLPQLVPNVVYDVVLADYLLGAVDVFTPFSQQDLFPALMRFMRSGPKARFYLVGLQPLPDKSKVNQLDEGAQLLSELVRTRDACITLAGHRPHREYPLDWVRAQLEASGLEVTRTRSFPNVYRAGRCALARDFVYTL